MKQIAEMNLKEILAAYGDHTPAVYLIGNRDFWFCKIGRSISPWLRLRDLDTPKLPFPLEVMAIVRTRNKADSWVERKLHEKFADRKIRGEWFRAIGDKEFSRAAKALLLRYNKGER